MNKVLTTFLIITLLSFNGYAQEESGKESKEQLINQLSFVFGYTHIPEAFEEGKLNESVYVPTIGIDYFWGLNEKWFFGGVLDVELGSYSVNYGVKELERESALIIGALVGYEVAKNWALITGPAIEFEKNKNLFVFRAGTEYRFKLENNWAILPALNFDFKEEYSSWSIGIGLGKKF